MNLHVGMKDDLRAQTKDQTNKALEVSKVLWSGYHTVILEHFNIKEKALSNFAFLLPIHTKSIQA